MNQGAWYASTMRRVAASSADWQTLDAWRHGSNGVGVARRSAMLNARYPAKA